jgi:hypothetical protein
MQKRIGIEVVLKPLDRKIKAKRQAITQNILRLFNLGSFLFWLLRKLILYHFIMFCCTGSCLVLLYPYSCFIVPQTWSTVMSEKCISKNVP